MTAPKTKKPPKTKQIPHNTSRNKPRNIDSPSAWTGKRIASAAVLGAFALFLLSMFCALVGPAVQDGLSTFFSHSRIDEPADIRLNSNPPPVLGEDMDSLSETPDTVDQSNKRSAKPTADIKIYSDPLKSGDPKVLGAAARKFERQGDLKKAITAQHKLVTLFPADMAHRLALAVLFDKISDFSGAAILYRQVIDAHEANDKTLPKDLDIEAIQDRLGFLSTKAK